MTQTEQLDLITLTVTPREARMLATAAIVRSVDLCTKRKSATLSAAYRKLSAKVDQQRSLA